MSFLNSLLRDKGGSAAAPFAPASPAGPTKVLNADLDRSLKYFLIFLVLGGGLAMWLSLTLIWFHAAPTSASLFNVGLVATLLLIATVFQSLLIQSREFNFLLIAAEGAALATFFYLHFSGWFLIGLLFFVLTWLAGYSRARIMLNNTMKINFWHYSVMLITASITSLAFFLAFLYVGLYQQAGGITFTAYRFAVLGAATGVQYVLPNFNPETKVDTFLEQYARNYFDKNANFSKLSEDQKQAASEQTAAAIKNQIGESTNLPVQSDDTIAGYSFRWVSGLLKNLQQRGLGALVVVGVFAFIFFSIKGVMFFVKWPVLIFSFLLYLLLQAVGVVTVGAEMRQKEVIVVK